MFNCFILTKQLKDRLPEWMNNDGISEWWWINEHRRIVGPERNILAFFFLVVKIWRPVTHCLSSKPIKTKYDLVLAYESRGCSHLSLLESATVPPFSHCTPLLHLPGQRSCYPPPSLALPGSPSLRDADWSATQKSRRGPEHGYSRLEMALKVEDGSLGPE